MEFSCAGRSSAELVEWVSYDCGYLVSQLLNHSRGWIYAKYWNYFFIILLRWLDLWAWMRSRSSGYSPWTWLISEFSLRQESSKEVQTHLKAGMLEALSGLVYTCVLIWIDDVLVYAQTLDELLKCLSKVFDKLVCSTSNWIQRKQIWYIHLLFRVHEVSQGLFRLLEIVVHSALSWSNHFASDITFTFLNHAGFDSSTMG